MPETLRDREIVLAGGAGGLGSAAAEMLAAEGARLVIGYRRNAERAERWRDRATVVQADLASAEDRRRLLDAAPALYGAGGLRRRSARVSDPAQMEEALATIVGGELRGADPAGARGGGADEVGRDAGRDRAARDDAGGGAVSRIDGVRGGEGGADARGAGFWRKSAAAPANVRVNVIAPGVMQAGMAEASIASGKYDRFLQEGTIARFGRAEDIARAVRFLLEPDNYITGQVLSVDGGITL